MHTAASIRRAAVATLALCVAVTAVAEAQGRNRPNRPARQHDRSNPWNPPGRQHDRSNPWNPGRQHDRTNPWNPGNFPGNWPNPWERSVSASAAGMQAASTPAARTLVVNTFRGGDRAQRSALVAALSTRDNIGAVGAAERLAKALDGLAAKPERLPQAVEAYNAFVRASSDGFLRAPSPEFVAVRELLTPATDLAIRQHAVDVADAGR